MTVVQEDMDLPGHQQPLAEVRIEVAGEGCKPLTPSYSLTPEPIRTVIGAKRLKPGHGIDPNGFWSEDLVPNSLLNPPGTTYRITRETSDGSISVSCISVPASGGPFQVSQLLVSPPGAIPDAALTLALSQPLSGANHGWLEPNLRSGTLTGWTRHLFSSDVLAPDSAVSFEHGQLTIRVLGGSGLQSNRREGWLIPGATPWPYWYVRSRYSSPPPADGIIEHGHMLNFQSIGGGQFSSVVVWDFIPNLFIAGVWQSSPDGSAFTFAQTGFKDQDAITAIARVSNVVTATVPAGATSRWVVGDPVRIDVATATFDGNFILSGVTNTTLTWSQLGQADDPAGGAGTATWLLNQTVGPGMGFQSDGSRTNGVVTTTTMPLGHPILPGDWVQVDAPDNTYDGRFIVSAVNPFTGQISWLQPGVANDAGMGVASISVNRPYWSATRFLPDGILQMKMWSDWGVNPALGGQGGGPATMGEPPWEGPHTTSWDLNELTGLTVPSGPGVPGVIAAHHSSNSFMRYDNIFAMKIPGTP